MHHLWDETFSINEDESSGTSLAIKEFDNTSKEAMAMVDAIG